MPAPILIVGQGLAGSLLAWEFERAGIDFEVVDRGHAEAASRVGAGIINPVTGRRLVKSWRVDALLAPALAVYREMEAALGARLVRPMRVRRFFADEREQRIFGEKSAAGELAPYVPPAGGDGEGFWIEGAAQVDTAALIRGMRARLLRAGRLREETFDPGGREPRRERDLTILCAGAASTPERDFGFARLRPAKGEMLTIETNGLDRETILNDGHWLLPLSATRAKVGATFEPGVADRAVSEAARKRLRESAARMLGRAFSVVDQEAGVRVTTADKHPVVGRAPGNPQVGIFNGLGSKGALLAPGLARQWVNHLTEGVPFDAAVDVARFVVPGG